MRIRSQLLKGSILLFFLISANGCTAKDKNENNELVLERTYQDQDNLTYKIREASGNENPVLVIMMHGFGADENDLTPLSAMFPENYIIVTPQTPFKIGDSNYQWYKNVKSKDGHAEADVDQLHQSSVKMKKLISYLQTKYNVGAKRTFVGGFSQGANMSYQLC